MSEELEEYDLDPTQKAPSASEPWGPDLPPERPRDRFVLGLVIAAGVVVVGAVGAYFLLLRKPVPVPSAAATPAAAPTPAAPASTESALPAIDESDSFVRELLRGLSPHPQLASWLGAEELVRRMAAAAAAVADGQSPTKHLGFLAPNESFRVVERRGKLFVDPKAYARYDTMADVVTSLDSEGCARALKRLEPLLESAYSQLGVSKDGFRHALARGFGVLLATPVPEDGQQEVRAVMRAALLYEYADPRLESLSPAQKHLLRMGPANARRVQAKLRELAGALGLDTTIPSS